LSADSESPWKGQPESCVIDPMRSREPNDPWRKGYFGFYWFYYRTASDRPPFNFG